MGAHALLTQDAAPSSFDEAVQWTLEARSIDLSVRFERLGEAEQILRMRFFADLIVALARAAKPFQQMSSEEVVEAIADHFRVPVSDVNYGLLYAIRSRRLAADDVSDGKRII